MNRSSQIYINNIINGYDIATCNLHVEVIYTTSSDFQINCVPVSVALHVFALQKDTAV
jgi:hypothetical protein